VVGRFILASVVQLNDISYDHVLFHFLNKNRQNDDFDKNGVILFRQQALALLVVSQLSGTFYFTWVCSTREYGCFIPWPWNLPSIYEGTT